MSSLGGDMCHALIGIRGLQNVHILVTHGTLIMGPRHPG
jgi:hypothetical protein